MIFILVLRNIFYDPISKNIFTDDNNLLGYMVEYLKKIDLGRILHFFLV